MRIGILGTGVVGRTLAAALDERHDVAIGTRDPAAAAKRTDAGPREAESFADWSAAHSGVEIASFADAADHAEELVINATAGDASLDALHMAGAEALAGKLLVDVSNPLDFSAGFPPSLFVSNTDSLAERIQRAFPTAKVVKTLNTVTANVMVDPGAVADGEHAMFVAAEDAASRSRVASFLGEEFGWRHVVDLGDLSAARAMEMYLPLWLRLMGALDGPMFNIAIAR